MTDDNGVVQPPADPPKRDEALADPPKHDEAKADPPKRDEAQADPPKRDEAQFDDSEDHVPLQVRLHRMEASYSDPQPLEVVHPEPTIKPKSNAQIMKEKLRLPPCGESHVTSCPMDFTLPRVDIMQFVESEPGPSNSARSPPIAPVEVEPTPTSGTSDWSLSDLPEEEWAKLENEAIMNVEMRKAKAAAVSKEVSSSIALNSTPKQPASNVATSIEPASLAALTTSMGPASGNSSISPAYFPHPTRFHKRTAIIRSPYIDFGTEMSFHCSKDVKDIYTAVCTHGTRSATSTEAQDEVIINFWSFYATLGNLAASVMPRGMLMSLVAEVAIHTLDDTNKKAIKRVLPLRVSTYLLHGELEKSEVRQAFWRSENHLDHRRMVMFPVLQMLGDGAAQVGHYFLLVLNLRNNRFEVLDSMRTLEDEALSNCCKILIGAIKELWTIHNYEAKKPICNYEVVDIGVPKQSNNHDCGYHMLMHAEY